MAIFMRFRRKSILAVFKLRRLVNRWLGTRDLDYPARHLAIFTDTIREYETRSRSVRKEPKTVSWIEKWVTSSSIFYDIGANVGAYSLIAASRGAKVLAFEPAYQNIYKLHKNISLNGLAGKISVVPIALSDADTIVRLKQMDDTFGATRRFSGKEDDPHGVSFITMRLDSIIRMLSLPVPTIVKIDVDGSEIEVLNGSEQLIKNPSLKSMLIEVDIKNAAEVKNILSEADFQVTDEEIMDEETINYIFTRV